VAGDDGDVGLGDVENLGEECDDGAVGAAVFGGLGDFDFEGVAEGAGDLGAGGVRDDFDVEEEGGAFGGDLHGVRVTGGHFGANGGTRTQAGSVRRWRNQTAMGQWRGDF
jgi:hypothetical protein